MSNPQRFVTVLKGTLSANGSVVLKPDGQSGDFGFACIDAGLFVDKAAGVTSFDLTIVDTNGRTLYTATGQIADVDQAASADGFQGPFTATVANYAGTGDLDIFLYVRS